MAQTPILGVRAVSPVPTTGSAIGYDGSGSGSTATDVQAELDRLETLVAAVGPLTVQEEDGTPSIPAASISVPNGSLGTVGAAAHLNYVPSLRAARQVMVTDASVAGTYTIDWSLANTWDLTLTANTTFSFSNVPADDGADYHINVVLRQGGTGSYTVVWPGAVKWQSATGTNTGSAPTLWTAVGAQDDFEFSTADGGTTVGGTHTSPPYTLTVNDEGTPLATGATSLDFVGAGVTASGTGVAKTITIPGGATSTDTGIWRPLLDAATGTIIVNGTTGEANMGFGAA